MCVDWYFVLFAIIGTDTVNLIRALSNDRLCEEANSAILCFVRQDSSIQFSRGIINYHKQVLPGLEK